MWNTRYYSLARLMEDTEPAWEGYCYRRDRVVKYCNPSTYVWDWESNFFDNLEERVFLLTLILRMNPHALYKLKDDYRAVICQSFGVGGLPGGGGRTT